MVARGRAPEADHIDVTLVLLARHPCQAIGTLVQLVDRNAVAGLRKVNVFVRGDGDGVKQTCFFDKSRLKIGIRDPSVNLAELLAAVGDGIDHGQITRAAPNHDQHVAAAAMQGFKVGLVRVQLAVQPRSRHWLWRKHFSVEIVHQQFSKFIDGNPTRVGRGKASIQDGYFHGFISKRAPESSAV